MRRGSRLGERCRPSPHPLWSGHVVTCCWQIHTAAIHKLFCVTDGAGVFQDMVMDQAALMMPLRCSGCS